MRHGPRASGRSRRRYSAEKTEHAGLRRDQEEENVSEDRGEEKQESAGDPRLGEFGEGRPRSRRTATAVMATSGSARRPGSGNLAEVEHESSTPRARAISAGRPGGRNGIRFLRGRRWEADASAGRCRCRPNDFGSRDFKILRIRSSRGSFGGRRWRLDLEVLVDQGRRQLVGEDVEGQRALHPEVGEDPLAPGQHRGGDGAGVEGRAVVGGVVGQGEDLAVAEEDGQGRGGGRRRWPGGRRPGGRSRRRRRRSSGRPATASGTASPARRRPGRGRARPARGRCRGPRGPAG